MTKLTPPDAWHALVLRTMSEAELRQALMAEDTNPVEKAWIQDELRRRSLPGGRA